MKKNKKNTAIHLMLNASLEDYLMYLRLMTVKG